VGRRPQVVVVVRGAVVLVVVDEGDAGRVDGAALDGGAVVVDVVPDVGAPVVDVVVCGPVVVVVVSGRAGARGVVVAVTGGATGT
jgi:hypothetical protein